MPSTRRWLLAGAATLALEGDDRLVVGRRRMTANTNLRLCRFLGLPKGYWLCAQVAYDAEVAARSLGARLASIGLSRATGRGKHRAASGD